MLRELFDGTGGVTSALDHARIEGANNPEALNVDAQAAKVARRAAEALRQSRAACQVLSCVPCHLCLCPLRRVLFRCSHLPITALCML